MEYGTDDMQTSDVETVPFAPGVHDGDVVADRYRVVRLIAEGGMATVYLAEDLRHARTVAVKVLHESLTHTIGIQRFLREIEVIARLQHPHLLTLIDSGTTNGFPYYVMPFVEAQSLRELIIERGQFALGDAITVAREIADGLAYAHERGVVHRDIKPSNILMSDGHAVVVDFGIATALKKSTVGRITVTGSSLGSPTYMSPEQAAGEHDVDARSDVYSLACVLYEMLVGRPPIDNVSMQQMLTRKLVGGYERLRTLRPDVPESFEIVLHKALSPDRDERYASMEEFSDAISLALPATRGISKRVKWGAATFALIACAAFAVFARHQQRVVWATQRVREVQQLAHAGKFHAAFALAAQVAPLIPADSAFRNSRSLYTDWLKVVTVPSGARVSIRKLDSSDTTWRTVGTTPIDSLAMPKSVTELGYRMRIERSGFETVDVLAALFTDETDLGGGPSLDTMFLDSIGRATSGMAHIRGIRYPDRASGPYRTHDFYVAKREVTNKEYARFVAAGGYAKQEYWTEPMTRDGKPIAWQSAINTFRDQSGELGPSTWRAGTYPAGQEDFPVGGVSWYEASAYARFSGMSLPSSAYWSAAAARGYREFGWMYLPSSNLNGTGPRRVGQGIMSVNGMFDVAGNVREWNTNAIDSGYLSRGATWEDSPFHVPRLISKPAFDRSPASGLRLAKILDDDSLVTQLSPKITRRVPYDYRAITAVSETEFAIFRRMYEYDRQPLQTKLEDAGELPEARWQKVSFSAAYDGPRMAAYLIYPKNENGPYEPIIVWGAANAIVGHRFSPTEGVLEMFAGFIPRSGRMLVIPLYMGTYERDDSVFSIKSSVQDSTFKYRDLVVQWVKDLRRTVDFLESRNDVRADRIGFFGASWGGAMAPIALAIETRIKAAVLYSGGYDPSTAARPEVSTYNYAPRVHTPTLMLTGRYDSVFPYESSIVPFFNQLGTPQRDKLMISSNSGHIVSMEVGTTSALSWFDRYLSHKNSATRGAN